MDLSTVDIDLLESLQSDASLTNQALAERVGISAPTALRRVRRLVDAGVIERRIALIRPPAPQSLQALVEVQLDRQGAEHLDAFEALAVTDPAVQQCWRVSPGPDFVLVLWLADVAAYNALVQRLFTQQANVRNVKTYFATKRAKFDPRVDLRALVSASAAPAP